MNSDELQYAVLKSVDLGFQLDILVGYKYTFREIGEMLRKLRKNGCISDLDGVLKVTEIGTARIKKLEKENNWSYKLDILPEYKYFIEKKGLFDIYLKK